MDGDMAIPMEAGESSPLCSAWISLYQYLPTLAASNGVGEGWLTDGARLWA